MKKTVVPALTLFVLSLLLFAATGAMAATQWKFATLAPKNVGWANQFRELIIPWANEATGGEVFFKVYWGGIMGNDDDYLKKMRIGQIEGAGMTGRGANLACHEFSVIGLPFLFENYEEVDYVRGKMYSTFDEYFASHGYKLVMWIDQDFDQFYSTKWKFDNLGDFARARIVTWYGPQEAAMLQALGATPISVGVPEVSTTVRTGVADTNIAPSIWQVGSQLYATSRYVNTMKIRYSPAVIMVSREAWNSLSEKHKKAMDATRQELGARFCAGIRKDNAACLQAMLEYGVRKVELTPEELAPIRERALTVYDDFSGSLYPPDLLEEVQRHLREFRDNRSR
ncbi:MAG: TRAP transporter substrate-binding protein DctP [Desulfatibacillaceae bacterium]